jgi:hypothetical protein
MQHLKKLSISRYSNTAHGDALKHTMVLMLNWTFCKTKSPDYSAMVLPCPGEPP